MTFGVALPPPRSGNTVDVLVEQAREAADAGLRSVWFGQRFDTDAIAVAGLVGREVPELTVGTSAVPIFARHPLLVAGQAQTSQAATRGRFRLGIALGAKDFIESAFGVPYDRPVARLREFLTVVRSVTTTGAADFHGETLTATTPMPAAVPGSDPAPPLLVAAMGPQALRVTGELADGILPFLAGPRALGDHIVPAITTAAERAGRPAPQIVALIPAVVTADVDAARETMARSMAFYDRIPSYQRVIALEGASKAADLAVVGDETTLATTVRDYLNAGATEVVLTQTDLTTPTDRHRTWTTLANLPSS